MQTFLPYANFAETAEVLDRPRLGKQRVEGLQIFNSLCFPAYGWKHHPAVKMWVGYEYALYRYTLAMCKEWTGRGYLDSVADTLEETANTMEAFLLTSFHSTPWWLSHEPLFSSHRATLLHKEIVRNEKMHYVYQGWKETPAYGYVWVRGITSAP